MVIKIITAPLLLYILYMTSSSTHAQTDQATKVKALEDVQGDVKDKEKQELEESMGDSLVKTYEYIMKAALDPGTSAYIGCFSVTDKWDAKKKLTISLEGNNNARDCISKCWEKRQRFALLWFAAECWCLNVIRYMTEDSPHSCNTACKGNGTQICGGVNRCTAYYTGYIHEPLYTHVTAKEITAAFRGCFFSSSYKNECPVTPPSHRMSVPTCMDICENNLFRFAGLTNYVRCCCDNNLVPYSTAEPRHCQAICRYGDKDYSCGGKANGHFSVYETGASKIVKGLKTSITKEIWMEPNINEDDIRVFGKPAGG